jgi:hypothetical protein
MFTAIALIKLDGFISLTFGLLTALFPTQIFSSAVDLASAGVDGNGGSLMESALLTLSGYYLLVGALLFTLADVPLVFGRRWWLLVAVHHAFMAIKGASEADRPWLTGSPWWDVAIHSAFVAGYLACLVCVERASPERTPQAVLDRI